MNPEETSERKTRWLSVRVEVKVNYTDATDLKRAQQNVAELARAAVDRSPWTEEVYFASTVTRKP